jgi:hypothetical protein
LFRFGICSKSNFVQIEIFSKSKFVQIQKMVEKMPLPELWYPCSCTGAHSQQASAQLVIN